MAYNFTKQKLTDAELMLQKKFRELKHKKLMIEKSKAKVETQPVREPPKDKKVAKIEARDARELANKLVRSGAIKCVAKDVNNPPDECFKKPCGLERKLQATTRSNMTASDTAVAKQYQPFAAPLEQLDPHEDAEREETKPKIMFGTARPKYKPLYDNFVSSGNAWSAVKEENPAGDGCKISVCGNNITEEYLRKSFATFGAYVSVSTEGDKRGVIVFEKAESATRAISKMDGVQWNGVKLEVSSANKQTSSNQSANPSSKTWSHIASSHSLKGNMRDKRNLVIYDDDM